MSQTGDRQDKQTALRSLNVTLAAVTGQVGCLTLLIIFAALFLGRWLDRQFDTSPLITIGLLIASIPITLIVMFWVVRAVTSRYGIAGKSATEIPEEGVERDHT
jgi:formate hydrogenlyase subunit 4